MRRVAVAQSVGGARGWIWLDGAHLVFVPLVPNRPGNSTRVHMDTVPPDADPADVFRHAHRWCEKHRLSIVEVDPEFRDGRRTEL